MPSEMSNWENMVDLVQADFGEGRLAEETRLLTVVLILKMKGTTVALASWR